MSISIVLADDHPVLRRGMRSLLESEPDMSVVGETGDGLATVRLVERLRPAVLVLDLMMPGLSGLEVLRVLGQRARATRTLVLSLYNNIAFIAEALRNGATGYVLKDCTEENLIRAVRATAAGKRFLSPSISETAIDAYIEQARSGPVNPHETLTVREREVLQLSAEGKTAAQIAAILHVSPRTIENHRARLMRKLGLQNLSELIRHALRHGLILVD